METFGAAPFPIVVAAFVAAIFFGGFFYRRKFDNRADEATYAAIALKRHYSAVERIIDDPASSIDIKAAALSISNAIANRKVAVSVVNAFYDGSLFTETSENSEEKLASELDKIRRTRPDLFNDFEEAVTEGVKALFLRWPENSIVLNKIMLELNRQRSSSIASHIRQMTRSNGQNDNGWHGGDGGISAAHCG